MSTLGEFALRLSEATDASTAAVRLAEYTRQLLPGGAAVRVYLLDAGDRCTACPRRASCPTQDLCFHLEASFGEFDRPAAHDERVPRHDTPWGALLDGHSLTPVASMPEELEGGSASESGFALMALEAGGENVGILGIRAHGGELVAADSDLRIAAFLTATTIRLLSSLSTSSRRLEQLLLVNELGRKVNSILNDELLLRQAAVDIHRTFGFHNVMIFMVDESRAQATLRAQASGYANPALVRKSVGVGEGVVGRVLETGRPIIIEDVARDDSYISWYPDSQSEIAVPIQNGGVVEGVLNVESDQVGAFGPSDRLVLETVANQLAIALENARLFSMVKEREDRYRTLVESSPGSVLHLDAEGRVIYSNPAATTLTGFDKAHFLTNGATFADLAVPGDRDALLESVQLALRGIPCRNLEFHITHADESPRWVNASLQPLVGENGDPRGVVVLARDKTVEKELQDRLNQSEKLSAIGTLVSGVAHELNNPLAGILGFAQLLLARPRDQWSSEDIEKIEKNAKRCQTIVENLLAFARQSRMQKRMASINDVIESVLNLNEYQFRMDNVQIEREFDTDVPLFPIDVNRWQQVFINLASNAHQALIRSEQKSRVIHLITQHEQGKVVILVRDNGPGIPLDEQSKIFEPFYTTKESGTGLGLGICFGIVEEHGGHIALDPLWTQGAGFRIEVPVVNGLEHRVEPSTVPNRVATNTGVGMRVLVVDDDPYICDVVTRALENHHYNVTVANNGRSALDEMLANPFDVLLTDVRMPGELDGIDLYDRLLVELPAFRDRIVFMTGNLLDDRTMERLGELPVRCIEKPFDIHRLAETVNEVLAQSRAAGDSGHSARVTMR